MTGITTAVYIPPDANICIALNHPHEAISKQQRPHPEQNSLRSYTSLRNDHNALAIEQITDYFITTISVNLN